MKALLIILIILLVLVGLFVLFIAAPTVISFILTCKGRKAANLTPETMKGTPYEPITKRTADDIAFFAKMEPETVEVRSVDGFMLRGRYIDANSENTAMFVHGYHTNAINNFATVARFLYEKMGYNILFIDQRACGESEGKFVTFGLRERYDIRTWIRFLTKKPEVKHIFVAGMSMGATSVAFTVDRLRSRKVRAVMLDCGFESPKNQLLLTGTKLSFPAQIMYPFARILGKLVFHEDFSESILPHLRRGSVPALFVHGTADSTVPFYEGENEYREYKGPKKKYFKEGAEHAVAMITDPEEGLKALRAFLEEYMNTELEDMDL